MSHPRIEFEADVFSPTGLTLLVDGTAQSHVDPADPTRLFFEYVRRLGHVLDAVAPEGEPIRVLHLGGGAMTLPRYVAATRPGSHQLVVELDPEVAA
ncbi:spermidine synthase, partial [Agromyces humi]|uniref:spermidine synthase n=1 Tax=Agromyces humi TaxID=1766800 RepID=UPI00193A7D5E